ANQKPEACVALAKLDHDFPNPGNTIKERVKDEKKNAGCSLRHHHPGLSPRPSLRAYLPRLLASRVARSWPLPFPVEQTASPSPFSLIVWRASAAGASVR